MVKLTYNIFVFLNVLSGLLGWVPQTLKYIRVLGGKEYPVILADYCYDQFFEYANGIELTDILLSFQRRLEEIYFDRQ